MKIYTSNINYVEKLLHQKFDWTCTPPNTHKHPIQILLKKLFPDEQVFTCITTPQPPWNHFFITEFAPESQYDTLVQLIRANIHLPNGIICFAGTGKNFHGFKNRTWVANPGNIHVSVYFAPNQEIPHFHSGFMILSAISVIQTIDNIKGLNNKSNIKWINDILIENTKVSGVLAHTQTQDKLVTGAVLGIGLNVESTPNVNPTIFVPNTACLNNFQNDHEKCNLTTVLKNLLAHIAKNYMDLMSGQYNKLFKIYLDRSLVIRKEVTIWQEYSTIKTTRILSGKVTNIGPNLELYIDGIDQPITKGRLVLNPKNKSSYTLNTSINS